MGKYLGFIYLVILILTYRFGVMRGESHIKSIFYEENFIAKMVVEELKLAGIDFLQVGEGKVYLRGTLSQEDFDKLKSALVKAYGSYIDDDILRGVSIESS